MASPDEPIVTRSPVVNIGFELRRELERVAREEGRDVTSLARVVLREYLEAREAERKTGLPRSMQ